MRFCTIQAVLCMASAVSAIPVFQNKGTTVGWDSINTEHKGTVQQSTTIFRKGPTALQMTQIFDPNYSGRYHSEVRKDDVYKLGDSGFYGFTFRLQDDWEFDEQSYNLAQFIADFSDTGCDDFMPSSMVWMVGNKLYSRVKQGSICAQKLETFPDLATVGAGVWHTVIIEASWKNDNTGFYRLYFDGQKVLDKSNIITTIKETRPFEFRVGLYANGWHDDKKMKGNQGTRTVFYDSIAAGSTLADVDPQTWDP